MKIGSPDAQVTLKAEKLIGGGRALAHHDGRTWMGAGALPDETVAALETNRRAGITEARTIAVVKNPHPSRLSEPCPHSGVCGGCDWPHVDPSGGAHLKRAAAAEAAPRRSLSARKLRPADCRLRQKSSRRPAPRYRDR